MQMSTESIAPVLKFETRAKQNNTKSIEAGHPVFDDVDYLIISPPGTRDTFEAEAVTWLVEKRKSAALGNYPLDWINKFEEGYLKWKQGQEMPESGWALKMCPAFTPAEIAMCASGNIFTVEALAQVPDQGLSIIGLNGRIMRDKAKTLLASAENGGKLAEQVTAMAADMQTLKDSLKAKDEKIAELLAELQSAQQSRQKLGLPKKESA